MLLFEKSSQSGDLFGALRDEKNSQLFVSYERKVK